MIESSVLDSRQMGRVRAIASGDALAGVCFADGLLGPAWRFSVGFLVRKTA
jgi:hypothetical protein